MKKFLAPVSASATAAPLPSGSALARDNCGPGLHRDSMGYGVSNYGRSSGCPCGYHLGWNVHACVPN